MWNITRITWSILWQLMPRFLVPLSHQQPWHWQCIKSRSLSFMSKHFNYLHDLNIEKWKKMQIFLFVSPKYSVYKGIITWLCRSCAALHRLHVYQNRSTWSMELNIVLSASPTSCITKFYNSKVKVVNSRAFHRWSLSHGSFWSSLIKVQTFIWIYIYLYMYHKQSL